MGSSRASRKWYDKLTGLLITNGYQQAASDASMFTKQASDSFTVLLVYVDDIILTGDSLSEISFIKNVLHQAFKIKDLGTLKYFLGLEVAHSQSGISLCQRKYCLDLLNDSGLLCSKPVSTPSDPSIKLHSDSSAAFTDVSTYRRLIGRLIYLNTTRLDITFITQQLSQFLSKPTQTHYNAAIRVLKYLKGSPGRGRATQMLTGQGVKTPGALFQVIVSFWGNHSFHGELRNNPLCQDLPLKLNTELWPLPLVNFNGSSIFSEILISIVFSCQFYIVTIKALYILQLTLFFMRGQNTLKLIATL
jgi:hypothetical protein